MIKLNKTMPTGNKAAQRFLATNIRNTTESKAHILKGISFFNKFQSFQEGAKLNLNTQRSVTSNIYYYGTNEKLKKMLASS